MTGSPWAVQRARVTLPVLAFLAVSLGCASPAPSEEVEGHLAIDDPAELTDEEAEAYYGSLKERLKSLYAASHLSSAERYQQWRRFNTTPYVSATHGNRYVNNYANRIAEAAGYAALKPGAPMPARAVIAKDSFTITHVRARFPGALFLMEKLAADAAPETAGWRYAMILPDGSAFGDSADPESGNSMMFCHRCHEQAADTDYLFGVPEKYRKRADGPADGR